MEKKQLLEDRFMTAAKFSQEVEKIALHNPDMNYIDSVIHYCEVNEIEILEKLLDQAKVIEAETGHSPTAVEALSWAIDEIILHKTHLIQECRQTQRQVQQPI